MKRKAGKFNLAQQIDTEADAACFVKAALILASIAMIFFAISLVIHAL